MVLEFNYCKGIFCRGECIKDKETLNKKENYYNMDQILNRFEIKKNPYQCNPIDLYNLSYKNVYYELIKHYNNESNEYWNGKKILRLHGLAIYYYQELSEIESDMSSFACGGSEFVAYRISSRSNTKTIIGSNGFPFWKDGRHLYEESDEENESFI